MKNIIKVALFILAGVVFNNVTIVKAEESLTPYNYSITGTQYILTDNDDGFVSVISKKTGSRGPRMFDGQLNCYRGRGVVYGSADFNDESSVDIYTTKSKTKGIFVSNESIKNAKVYIMVNGNYRLIASSRNKKNVSFLSKVKNIEEFKIVTTTSSGETNTYYFYE
jgi:hypothetical protein